MSQVHHTNVRIRDARASLAFYGKLGLRHVGTAVLGPGYTLLFLGGASGAAIELVVNETADASYDRAPGSGHIGIEVPDLDAALAELATLGVEPEAPPAHPAGRTDLGKVAFVRDPDGVRVELLQAPWPIPSDPVPEGLVLS